MQCAPPATPTCALFTGAPQADAESGDGSGFDAVVHMLEDAESMHNLFVIYTFLQSLLLLLFIFRLIALLVFQPRLAVMPRTLAAIVPDLLHFLITLGIVVVMVAMVRAPSPAAPVHAVRWRRRSCACCLSPCGARAAARDCGRVARVRRPPSPCHLPPALPSPFCGRLSSCGGQHD